MSDDTIRKSSKAFVVLNASLDLRDIRFNLYLMVCVPTILQNHNRGKLHFRELRVEKPLEGWFSA